MLITLSTTLELRRVEVQHKEEYQVVSVCFVRFCSFCGIGTVIKSQRYSVATGTGTAVERRAYSTYNTLLQ